MQPTSAAEVLIVGAGIAGLSLARHLRARGVVAEVLERARGVGGRCATRHLEGVAFDHGVSFLHASDPALMRACREGAGDTRSWPNIIVGDGPGLRPEATRPETSRLAFVGGIHSLPRALARGVRVTLEAKVTALRPCARGFEVQLDNGAVYRAPTVALALAAEQTTTLMTSLAAAWPALRAVTEALGRIASSTCHALIALYPNAPALEWEFLLPAAPSPLATLAHESTKRPTGAQTALVFTRRAPPTPADAADTTAAVAVAAEMLRAAGDLLGPWAAAPEAQHLHRWRYAQRPPGAGYTGPTHLVHPRGGQLALCGDFCGAVGGIEGAWLSGRRLAQALATTAETRRR